MTLRQVAIIPARLASTRLPGKPLLEIAGRPLIQHVYERARQAPSLDDVLVATDSESIVRAVAGFGGKALLTSEEHTSGTSRILEIISDLDADVVLNLQGDEPQMPVATIEAVLAALGRGSCPVATACVRIRDAHTLYDENAVKVVFDTEGRALYFSRWPIPFVRGQMGLGRQPEVVSARHYKHLGIYAYTKAFLMSLKALPGSALAETEQLEQLRFLELGYSIRVVEVTEDCVGVDTVEDLERVRKHYEGVRVQGSGFRGQGSGVKT